jgi:hypothetical protein
MNNTVMPHFIKDSSIHLSQSSNQVEKFSMQNITIRLMINDMKLELLNRLL